MDGIDEIWPGARSDLTDEQILGLYAPPPGPWLRLNFVESLDGAVTREGRSGGLGGDADRRVFELLRRWADVVLVGAGTVRTEGYGAMRLPAEAASWRRAHGLTEQPVFALVSGRLDLDPDSPVFTEAPVRPLVLTMEEAPAERRARLAEVADVVDVGTSEVDPRALREALHARGHERIHSEGGPTLFGTLLAAGVVDELCLTLAPTLEAGGAGRIALSPAPAPTAMAPAGILRSGGELLLRYTRADAATHADGGASSADA
jgi:riboflavin biosynthesis pyrimidine reductase